MTTWFETSHQEWDTVSQPTWTWTLRKAGEMKKERRKKKSKEEAVMKSLTIKTTLSTSRLSVILISKDHRFKLDSITNACLLSDLITWVLLDFKSLHPLTHPQSHLSSLTVRIHVYKIIL